MPELDRVRRQRLEDVAGRFVTPEGFSVEQVAGDAQVGSVVNLTFDHQGRPALALQDGGILLLEDSDGDGTFERKILFSDQVETAHGMEFLAPGELLVHAEGPQGTGLYLLKDRNGDDRSDSVELITPSVGKIAEHGPHEIELGPDGLLYVLFGNHAAPEVEPDPLSPSRDLREDHLLPRYLDPRGHANHIRAPAGTLNRLDLSKRRWEQIAGGFRNPFDFAIDASGELLTFEADMEWDFGLPWYREIRVLHVIPGGDYGWRTGSGKFQPYYMDTLPSVDESGRGSPVGIAIYQHHVYPEKYKGALFMGDWSRGRIRVIFPRPQGATLSGETVDFLHGEPLNVTDLDIGPDGFLYFATGGRSTTGGIYRVRFEGSRPAETETLETILNQPMPRSAWGRHKLAVLKEAGEAEWTTTLEGTVGDSSRSPEERLRALEALQLHGPKPDRDLLVGLLSDGSARVRAASVFLLGTFPWDQVSGPLTGALSDPAPLVIRRAAEALVRAGLSPDLSPTDHQELVTGLRACLQNQDRFVRYSCRQALRRGPGGWSASLVRANPNANPRLSLESMLAFAQEMTEPGQAQLLFDQLEHLRLTRLNDPLLLDYLRLLQVALMRDPRELPGAENAKRIGRRLLLKFPHTDSRLNRELLVLLSHLQVPGITGKGLALLEEDLSREDQIHVVYCLRTVSTGWTAAQRLQLVGWFEKAWGFRGAASMEGFLEKLWESTLALLTPSEVEQARRMQDAYLDTRMARLAAYLAEDDAHDPSRAGKTGDRLVNMSFEELSDYLEYDPMSYERGSIERGRKVFYLSQCVNCHVFGTEGRGGGPDLSTVVSRFRRREILESMMFPSRTISDQYQAWSVRLENGTSVTGMFAGESEETLNLITATGERIDIAKSTIAERLPSDESIMPEGLLDSMTVNDLVSLMLFLEAGG